MKENHKENFEKVLSMRVPGSKERTAQFLAMYLPENVDSRYRGIEMTPEERTNRRLYIRRKLKGSSFGNLSNEELDNSIYYELEGKGIFEDPEGHCYALAATMQSAKDMQFRKVRAMIPFEYKGLKASDFRWDVYPGDPSGVKETLNRYLLHFGTMREKGMGLYIYSGTKGSGKTMLSCCILNELAEKHALNVKFINVLDLLDMTKKSYKGNQPEISAIYDAAVLVLDDIGAQISREWTDTVLYQLINKRYNERRITIYTSNVKVDNLKMDERIRDRIESNTYSVNLPEVPVRKKMSEDAKNRLLEELEKRPPESGNPPEDNVTR